MYVPFNELPESSKIWIYQSDRKLNEGEIKNISEELQLFCENWAAHNQNLKTSFDIKHQHFIILAVDESLTGASGCSIDGSVKKIKEIEGKYSLEFFNRLNLAFLINNEVNIIDLNDLNEEIKSKKITKHSIFFNNLAPTIGGMSSNWAVSVENTWLKKYFNNIK